MWKCHKCGKPVYFAERKQSLGYDWHPECLRCEECGKRLNPGQHAEHKGVPYCHVPCYGALFGPQLFGHGTRVESHKSYGQVKECLKINNGPVIPRELVENKLKSYNQFFDGRSGEVRSREVNGRIILEGPLRIHWGIQGVIHLKEDDDQRTVTVRKRNSCRLISSTDYDSDDTDEFSFSSTNSNIDIDSSLNSLTLDNSISDTGIESGGDTCDNVEVNLVIPKSVTLPSKLDFKNLEWDELDDLLQVERKVDDSNKLYQTMPAPLPSQSSSNITDSKSIVTIVRDCVNGILKTPEENNDNWIEPGNHLNRSMSGPDCLEHVRSHSKSPEFDQISINSTNTDISGYTNHDDVVFRRPKSGSTAIKRRPGKRLSRNKIKRRCSINGHFYNRETSFFTPPHGSQMSVWVTSLVSTQEVINLILEKYKVESEARNFALFVVYDNGEQKRLREEEYPLLVRVLQGPHEDVVRMFMMDSNNTPEVSNEVAQFLNLSLPELKAILNQYYTQEDREITRIQEKFCELKKRIKARMEELKVRL